MWKALALTALGMLITCSHASRVNRAARHSKSSMETDSNEQQKIAASQKARASSAVSALGYRSGDTLFGRFKLRNLITVNGSTGIRYLPDWRAVVDFPDELKARYQGPDGPNSSVQLLGSGSFGETWVVTDSSAKHGDKAEELALKLFFTRDKSVIGAATLLNKEMIENGDAKLKKSYEDSIRECELAQRVQSRAKQLIDETKDDEAKQNYALYASRLMRCYEHADDPAYVLLSYGGEDTLSSHTLKKQFQARFNSTDDVNEAGLIFKQMLQGLQMLAWCDPPLIHHDLKSDNVVVRIVDGKPQVTLIDFGAFKEYTDEKQKRDSVSTFTIAPPEWIGAVDDSGDFTYCEALHRDEGWSKWGKRQYNKWSPWGKDATLKGSCSSAFDVYSAGSILVQLLTTKTPFEWSQKGLENPILNQPEWEIKKHERFISKMMALPGDVVQLKDWIGDIKAYGKNMYEWVQANCTTSDALVQLGPLYDNTTISYPAQALDDASKAFIDTYVPTMFEPHAEDRPDPELMLGSTWLAGL